MFVKKSASIRTKPTGQSGISPIHLRNDIACGFLGCPQCARIVAHHQAQQLQQAAAAAPPEDGVAATGPAAPALRPAMPVMVPDTNIVLHSIDALEDPRVVNLVFLATVLAETRNRNRAVYARVQRLIADAAKQCYVLANDRHEATHCARRADESPNDYNDRCIRVAARWLHAHAAAAFPQLAPPPSVTLVSHDAALHAAFAADDAVGAAAVGGARCMRLRDFLAETLGDASDLLDRIQHVAAPAGMKEVAGGALHAEHLPEAALQHGVASGALLRGKLRVGESSCFFGEVRGAWKERLGADRVLIAGRVAINRALHDDVVAVEVLPVEQWRGPGKAAAPASAEWTPHEAVARGFTPCGRVVGLLDTQARRPLCGSVDGAEVERLLGPGAAAASGEVTVLFQPKSGRMPRIRIRTRQLADIADKRLCVVVDDWPAHCAYPNGHYVEVLGRIGDRDTEAKVILLENDVPHYDFSQAVYDCLPQGAWRAARAGEPGGDAHRRDLTALCVVSVDPLGCRDIDDALHFRVLPSGRAEVGVHIADVTHFVREGTALDEEAARRSTSVYLVDRRIDMLPKLLTENLCSIVANEDRFAFSIVWEFDEQMRCVSEWAGKTIIHSRAALYYGDAQRMIDDPADTSDIATSLRGLMRLSRHFKAERERAGALFLASQEFKFKLDNDHVSPTDMAAYQTFEANSMIEEWMLYANAAAARRIYAAFPNWTLLRRHQRPAEGAFDTLNEALQRRVGVRLEDASSLALNRSLDRCVDPADPFFNKLVRILTTRCLRQAQYFSSSDVPYDEFAHFGLAMPIYTHFTSPIRRFADVIVHRQLAAALGIAAVSTAHTNSEAMAATAANINYRHEQAQKAGRDSQNLYTGLVLRNAKSGGREAALETGYVVKVSDTHIFVMVPKYGQEGKIERDALPPGVEVPPLLERVAVRIRVVQQGDVMRTKLVYTLASPADDGDAAGAPPDAAAGPKRERGGDAEPTDALDTIPDGPLPEAEA